MKSLFTLATTLVTFAAFAHDGHGLLGSHWHATDVMGFAAAGGVVAVLFWLSGRNK